MTKTTCDICNNTIDFHIIKIQVRDGEHPHNGSTMRKTIDCCAKCASNITDLTSCCEYDDLRYEIGKKRGPIIK